MNLFQSNLVKSKSALKLAWVFDSSPDDVSEAARELYRSEPAFRDLITQFDERLAAHTKNSDSNASSLRDWLESDEPTLESGDTHCFVLQAGLAKVWESWGIQPDQLLGIGIGQYAATCAAGGLCWLDAIMLIGEREAIVKQIDQLRSSDQLQPQDGEEALEEQLPAELNEALDRFEAFADTINYYPPNIPLICSLEATQVPVFRSLGGSYWREHCLRLPKEAQSLEVLREANCDFALHVGQASNTQRPAGENYLTSLSHKHAPCESMFHTLGLLYVAGAMPDFKSMYAHDSNQRLSMPTYPFQKKRYWITEISNHMPATAEQVES